MPKHQEDRPRVQPSDLEAIRSRTIARRRALRLLVGLSSAAVLSCRWPRAGDGLGLAVSVVGVAIIAAAALATLAHGRTARDAGKPVPTDHTQARAGVISGTRPFRHRLEQPERPGAL